MSAKRAFAWAMIIFAVTSTPLSLVWFARDEPPFVIILSELALVYTALDALWQAEQMESTERGEGRQAGTDANGGTAMARQTQPRNPNEPDRPDDDEPQPNPNEPRPKPQG